MVGAHDGGTELSWDSAHVFGAGDWAGVGLRAAVGEGFRVWEKSLDWPKQPPSHPETRVSFSFPLEFCPASRTAAGADQCNANLPSPSPGSTSPLSPSQ